MTFPTPTFETERLTLRPISLADALSYEKNFVDYEVIRYLSRQVPWPYPVNGVETYLRDVVLPALGRDRWMWGIVLREDPAAVIGAVDLWRTGIPENRGFWLARAHWGKGLMTEAVAPITSYAFDTLGFDRLIFSNAAGNLRSRRIKEKAGATFLGLRPASFVDPAFTEAETWELTAKQWRATQK